MSTITIFDDLQDALLYLEVEAEMNKDFLKGELFRTSDNRWRVGVIYYQQMELDFNTEYVNDR